MTHGRIESELQSTKFSLRSESSSLTQMCGIASFASSSMGNSKNATQGTSTVEIFRSQELTTSFTSPSPRTATSYFKLSLFVETQGTEKGLTNDLKIEFKFPSGASPYRLSVEPCSQFLVLWIQGTSVCRVFAHTVGVRDLRDASSSSLWRPSVWHSYVFNAGLVFTTRGFACIFSLTPIAPWTALVIHCPWHLLETSGSSSSFGLRDTNCRCTAAYCLFGLEPFTNVGRNYFECENFQGPVQPSSCIFSGVVLACLGDQRSPSHVHFRRSLSSQFSRLTLHHDTAHSLASAQKSSFAVPTCVGLLQLFRQGQDQSETGGSAPRTARGRTGRYSRPRPVQATSLPAAGVDAKAFTW